MQKRKSIKSKISDFFVVLFCLSGAALSLWLFYRDFYAVLERQNEKPIATVIWKKNTTQRKFSDRLVWDRLQENSSIYNGDTIRTANNAATTIELEENTIELGSNTIIQLVVSSEGETELDFSSGDISASVGNTATKGLKLKSGNVTVDLEKGSTISAVSNSGIEGTTELPLQLRVTEGKASVQDENGIQTFESGEIINISETGEVTKNLISILEPMPQEKVLAFDSTFSDVKFSWNYEKLPEGASIVFESATDKDFVNLVDQIGLSGLKTMTIRFSEGTNYWRFYVIQDGEILSDSITEGKINLLSVATPTAVTPAEMDQFSYRTKKPSLRFVWNGNEHASRYLFEVADNPQMNNPVISQSSTFTSSIVSSLGIGTWYWRITPYYSINNIGYSNPSKVNKFVINRLSKLSIPRQNSPSDGGFVNIANTESQKENIGTIPVFSWYKENDATFYTFKVASDPQMQNIIATEILEQNFVEFMPPSVGRYYWTVSQTDAEGNESETSEVFSFIAIDKEIEFYLVFPPDEYQLAEARVLDTRFTWKNNLPDNVKFQLALDKQFENLITEETITPDTLSYTLKRLEAGTYYWRLLWGTGETEIATKTREIKIVTPLEKPKVTSPKNSENIIIKPEEKVTFQWEPVKEAQYYHFELYLENSTAQDAEAVYTELYIEDTKTEVLLDDLPSGKYRWTVQAFADESLLASRRTGLLQESYFNVTKVYPVRLKTPENNKVFSGLDGFFNPADFSFESLSLLTQAELVISRNKDALPKNYGQELSLQAENQIVYREKINKTTGTFPRLNAGTYWYTINAQTLNNIDVSAENQFSFTVLPIEPFEKVDIKQPQNNKVYNETFLTNSLYDTLKFTQIPEAEAYNLVIKNANTNKVILETYILPEDNQELTFTLDFVQLGLGNFICSIEALRFMPGEENKPFEEREILQEGKPATIFFTVSLPKEEISSYDLGDLYGN